MDLERRVAEEEEAYEEPEAPQGGYRVAGDVEVRSKHLEQQLAETKATMRAMERELYSARKTLRLRRAATAFTNGGVGSALGSVLALLLYGTDIVSSPPLCFAVIVLAFVFGALTGIRFPNGKFPDAPPPRMH